MFDFNSVVITFATISLDREWDFARNSKYLTIGKYVFLEVEPLDFMPCSDACTIDFL